MPTHQLYATAFFEDALDTGDPSARRQQSSQGVLQQSVGSVETIAAEPGQRAIRGDFTGQYANVMAAELQELLSASDVIGEVPYFVVDDDREWAGYYAPESQREGDRRDPRIPGVNRFGGVLSPVGTRRSHVRAVTVEPRTETNPLGSATTETLWLASDANRPRWIHEPTGAIEAATVQTTEAGAERDFDKFDVTEPAFANESTYTLIYDLPYEFEAPTDPVVWDDYGRARQQAGPYAGSTVSTSTAVGTATVGSQNVVDNSWQRVYKTQHDYIGERVIENGRLRLEPRPASEVLRAYRWNETDSQYDSVQLGGGSSWRLIGWDITRIGLSRVVGVGTWEDTANRGTTFELVAEVRRGSADVLFYEPENASGSTPAGLVTRLDAIASDTDQVLGEAATVVRREDVPDV